MGNTYYSSQIAYQFNYQICRLLGMATYELSAKEKARLAAEAALSPTHEDKLAWTATQRRRAEDSFRRPIAKAISDNPDALQINPIEVFDASSDQKKSLANEFPSGNYIFHSANTDAIIKILHSGNIANLVAINEDLETRAREAGTLDEHRVVRGNSGEEGISWSLNNIDAMPGTRAHLAGFVASPEAILPTGDKFCVPSRPAPYEVLQVSKNVNTPVLYDLKIQWELLFSMSPWDENNSIADGIIRFKSSLDTEEGSKRPSLLRDFYDKNLKTSNDISEISNELRKFARFENGRVVLSPELQEQSNILVSAVWLQCLVDNNAFEGTNLENANLKEVLEGMIVGEYPTVFNEFAIQRDFLRKVLQVHSNTFGRVEAPVSEMYFVCPKADVNLWQTVMARMEVKPKGIVVYDGTQIRLENFASKTEGHNKELSAAIRSVVGEGDDRRLAWDEDVLGMPFDDSMRRGYAEQCVGSEFIGNSKTLTSNGIDLKIIDPRLGTRLGL